MLKSVCAALCLSAAVAATGAAADERWAVDGGEAFYESDVLETAVISFPYGEGRGRLYVEGLVGNLDARGTHAGYWIADGTEPCSAMLTGPDGVGSYNWGWATVEFDSSTFPSAFTAFMGECAYDGQSWELRALPY